MQSIQSFGEIFAEYCPPLLFLRRCWLSSGCLGFLPLDLHLLLLHGEVERLAAPQHLRLEHRLVGEHGSPGSPVGTVDTVMGALILFLRERLKTEQNL